MKETHEYEEEQEARHEELTRKNVERKCPRRWRRRRIWKWIFLREFIEPRLFLSSSLSNKKTNTKLISNWHWFMNLKLQKVTLFLWSVWDFAIARTTTEPAKSIDGEANGPNSGWRKLELEPDQIREFDPRRI